MVTTLTKHYLLMNDYDLSHILYSLACLHPGILMFSQFLFEKLAQMVVPDFPLGNIEETSMHCPCLDATHYWRNNSLHLSAPAVLMLFFSLKT